MCQYSVVEYQLPVVGHACELSIMTATRMRSHVNELEVYGLSAVRSSSETEIWQNLAHLKTKKEG